MATDVIISKDNTNETISIVDSTDYPTLGISITDVNGIRYLFASYNSILNASIVTEIKANTEYVVESGNFLLNGISYQVGDVFVAYEDYTLPTSGVQVKKTGYFCLPNGTIPSTQIKNTFTPSDLNENSETFADALRKVRYEIFTTLGTPATDGLYLVNGTQSDYIETEDGETVYVGQVYNVVVGDNSNFTAYGNAYPVKYFDTSISNFWTDYNATQVKNDYSQLLSNPTYSVSEDFRANYLSCVSALSLPYNISYTGINYSEADIQNALDYINGILNTKLKDIRINN